MYHIFINNIGIKPTPWKRNTKYRLWHLSIILQVLSLHLLLYFHYISKPIYTALWVGLYNTTHVLQSLSPDTQDTRRKLAFIIDLPIFWWVATITFGCVLDWDEAYALWCCCINLHTMMLYGPSHAATQYGATVFFRNWLVSWPEAVRESMETDRLTCFTCFCNVLGF